MNEACSLGMLEGLAEAVLANERLLHRTAAWLIILVGCAVLVVELGLGARAPYGRHASLPVARYYGPTLHPKVAWAFQESWALAAPVALLACGGTSPHCLATPGNVALLAMYLAHFGHRTAVYPLRLRGGARMPVGLCVLAAAFLVFNGYVQARAWMAFDERPVDSAAAAITLVTGSALWAVGFGINLHSDGVLRGLRAPGESGYRVPQGGAFEYVSCANYFGETVEWCGYALASGGALPAVAFAFFTFANLAPRAHQHHRWAHMHTYACIHTRLHTCARCYPATASPLTASPHIASH